MIIDRRAPVSPLRSRAASQAGYGDPGALNDIHALLTGSADLALLRSALALAARGWHVFPCAAGRKRPAFRQSWQDLATDSPDRVRAWWSRQPYNIGVSCGPSGLVIVDLDVPHGARPDGNPEDEVAAGGIGSFAGLCQRHGEPYPPVTFSVDTPSGGRHLYFAAAGDRLRNSAGLLGPLVDVRADGGYVVGPGSRIGQHVYTVRDSSPPMPLPPWIAGTAAWRCRGDASGGAAASSSGQSSGHGLCADGAPRGDPTGRHRAAGNAERHAQPGGVQPRPACGCRAAPAGRRHHRAHQCGWKGRAAGGRGPSHHPLGDGRRAEEAEGIRRSEVGDPRRTWPFLSDDASAAAS